MKNKNTDSVRYLVRMWTDYFNENGKHKKTESYFARKDEAIKEAKEFLSRHPSNGVIVVDLLSDTGNRAVFSDIPK